MTVSILVVLLGVPSAQASNPQADFQLRTERLKKQQAQTDQLLSQVKARAGIFDEAGIAPGKADEPVQPLFKIHAEASTRTIPAGKLIFGELVNRLVVGSDSSPTLIQLDEAQGSLSELRIMGTARQSGTAGRISIEVSRLVLRNGSSLALKASTLDASGGFGLEAQVFSSKALAVGGALASSFISGLAAGSQTQMTSPFGVVQTEATGRNAILQGVAQTAADQSKRFIEEATSEKPILVVEPGTPVSILVDEEVRF
jgi:hypothetical protein